MTTARLALAALLAILPGYAGAGLIGGAIPTNVRWRPPASGITVYIEDNGIHTAIVMPKNAAGIDWRAAMPAADLGDPRHAGWDHVAVSWGERNFFLDTPTWADLRPGTIATAAIGSNRTLLHVEHLPRPVPGRDVRALTLRPPEYRRLAAFVLASRAAGGKRHPGYGQNDAFYDARGHYDALRTCNDWTGDALRAAGVRVGAWTPFPATVMWWL